MLAVITSLHAETTFNNTVMKAIEPSNQPHVPVIEPLQGKEDSRNLTSIADITTTTDDIILNTTTATVTATTTAATPTTTTITTPTTAATSSTTTTTTYNTSTMGMRFLPLITLGITIPMLVSPTMLTLWTVTGNGNANYLFFQGLVMWAFLATAMVEFTNATIRELDD